ncbi:GNAT family N-acetyltransferase [Cellulomonas sp. S1-8]|uniref:GNAT family N-acetyltransferase n=1 Tax=Cellulomonas sp. S1-8 TaxID=2904790 RepID=UPI002242FCEA|nr:GNAT family N-acetyltransferase [Cellulomonas sp. S1-8]UZN03042.1 GNAT family N-acetyltransferase [Cellulomonas sp. S1-8]
MVRYVGLDLAWGRTARTGIAVLDDAGRLVHSSSVRTDDEIADVLEQHTAGQRVVAAIDAPLVVPNLTGRRVGEVLVTRHFGRFDAGAHSSNRSHPHFDPPRAQTLADRHGWDVDPAVRPAPGVSVAIEVYPHPAMVVLFGLGRVLPYKGKHRRGLDVRRAAWVALLDHVERVAGDVLGLGGNVRWAEVRAEVVAAERAAVLERLEDEVDAIVCAYLAWLWETEPERMVVLGSSTEGYIVVPGLPTWEPSPRVASEAMPEGVVRVTAQTDAATVAQVAELFVAYRAFYGRQGDADAARAFLRARVERADSLVWAVVEDGRAVAFTQVYPGHSSLRLSTTWQLNDLFVAPDVRGGGAGATLVRQVLAEASDAGADEVRLETQRTNTRARALYERLGFGLAADAGQDGEFLTYTRTPGR